MSVRPSLPASVDVAIIGGGIMGTSICYFLAKRTDLEVVLLEKDNIASGSTGDSSAILRHHYGPAEQYSKMAWWSHEFYRSFEENTGEVIAYADNPLVRFAREDSAAGSYAMDGYDVLSALDIPVSRVEQDEFDEAYPMLELDEIDFAVSDDTAGYSDGTDAANGFARAASELGATIMTGTRVSDVHTDGGAVTAVETEKGTVDCTHVVMAAGPWITQLAEKIGVEVPVEAEREQILILDPPDEYADKYPNLTPTTAMPGGEWYIRPDFGDGILIATHHTDEFVDPERYDGQPDEETLLELSDEIRAAIPELADAGIQGQYCGVYSTTPDHDFIIDQAGPQGCYVACGFSGHGFKHAPAVGRIMTDLITDGATDFVDLEFFSLDRFTENAAGNGLPDDGI